MESLRTDKGRDRKSEIHSIFALWENITHCIFYGLLEFL